MAASNGMSEFKIMATPPTNVNTPKKVTLPVAKQIQKLGEKGFSDSEIVYHLLEKDGLAKPAIPKDGVKGNSVKFRRQGRHTMRNSHS